MPPSVATVGDRVVAQWHRRSLARGPPAWVVGVVEPIAQLRPAGRARLHAAAEIDRLPQHEGEGDGAALDRRRHELAVFLSIMCFGANPVRRHRTRRPEHQHRLGRRDPRSITVSHASCGVRPSSHQTVRPSARNRSTSRHVLAFVADEHVRHCRPPAATARRSAAPWRGRSANAGLPTGRRLLPRAWRPDALLSGNGDERC